MFGLFLALLAGGLFGFVIAGWLANRRPGRIDEPVTGFYWLNYTGSDVTFLPAEWTDDAKVELKADTYVVPARECRLVRSGGLVVALSGISDLHLSDLTAMREARQALDMRSIHKGGGSVKGFLGAVAPLLVIVLTIFTWQQVGSLGSAQAQVVSDLGAVKQLVSSPLVCKAE